MPWTPFLAKHLRKRLAWIMYLGLCPAAGAQDVPPMGFFITSRGVGNGANLGGLAGADAHCQMLAAAVGAGDRTWQAYLSAQPKEGQPAVNARDRIGLGPWHNAKGVLIANDLTELHGENHITKATALDEKGQIVNGRGDSPNRHDILTGSQADGTVVPGTADSTCSNWTSSGAGSAMLGHHDRQGGGTDPLSWNSAHGSRGCSQSNLRSTGGDGLFYCFAIDRSLRFLIPLDNSTLTDPVERLNYVRNTLKTWIGDSSMDGLFNSTDLVGVFQAGGYEDDVSDNASWATGDWTGDKEFNSADLVVAFQDGGFEMGPRSTVGQVPEPTSTFVGALLTIGLHSRRSRRHLS